MEKVFILAVECVFDDEKTTDIIAVYKNKEDAMLALKEQIALEKEHSFLCDYFYKDGKLISGVEFDEWMEKDDHFFFADKKGNLLVVYIVEKVLFDYDTIDRLLKIWL